MSLYQIPKLKDCRILVTNDDGYGAPGIKLLEKIARGLSDDVWVVAPDTEKSGAGHSLTLTEPLRLRKYTRQRFSVKGTPTDCVMMAVSKVMADKRPDLLLSGINVGANMGEDVTYSGTLAACMEGVLAGIPSIGLSQALTDRRSVHWSTAETFAPDIIRKLAAQSWDKDTFISVNFPDLPKAEVKGIEVVPQGRRDFSALEIDERMDSRGREYYWLGYRPKKATPKRQTDLGSVDAGYVAITPLHLEMTEKRTLKKLKASFS